MLFGWKLQSKLLNGHGVNHLRSKHRRDRSRRANRQARLGRKWKERGPESLIHQAGSVPAVFPPCVPGAVGVQRRIGGTDTMRRDRHRWIRMRKSTIIYGQKTVCVIIQLVTFPWLSRTSRIQYRCASGVGGTACNALVRIVQRARIITLR